MADKLTNFNGDARLLVVHHMHLIRKVTPPSMDGGSQWIGWSTFSSSFFPHHFCVVHTGRHHQSVSKTPSQIELNHDPMRPSVLLCRDNGHEDFVHLREGWGMMQAGSYVALIAPDRIALAQVKSERGSMYPEFAFIWSCPAQCMEQFFCDAHGDLVVSVNRQVVTQGGWHSSQPVVLDRHAQDYVLFQSLLEQTIGLRLARMQPLNPIRGGLVGRNLLKR